MPDQIDPDQHQSQTDRVDHRERDEPSTMESMPASVGDPEAKDKSGDPGDLAPQATRASAGEIKSRLSTIGKHIDWLMALNIVVALGTSLQACFAYRSNELTRLAIEQNERLTKEALEQNASALAQNARGLELTARDVEANARQAASGEQAVANAARANELVDTSVRQAREAMRLDRRAWLGVVDGGVRVLEAGKSLSLYVAIKNTGQTPAINTSVHAFMKMAPAGNLLFEYPASRAPDGITVLQPQQTVTNNFVSERALNEDNVTRLKDGTWTVYTYGVITYSDIFDKQHETKFCAVLARDLKTLESCYEHNTAN